jgi:23S rRNA pseudouridine2605 synthase
VRINQFLARAGFGSRRACEELVTQGAVMINGEIIESLATKVNPTDKVKVNGSHCKVSDETITVAMNKPKSYVCTMDDPQDRRRIYDLLPGDFPRVVSIGRLDYDSEGLILLTSDGDLANELTHPSSKVPKTYEVVLDRDFDFELSPRLKKGINVEGKRARMESIHRIGPKQLRVVLTQGIKRQIRWMFFKVGYKVKNLKRVQIGKFELGRIPLGKCKVLTPEEIQQCRSRMA